MLSGMDDLARLLRRARPYRRRLLAGLGFALLAAPFPAAMVKLFDLLLQHLNKASELAAEGKLTQRLLLIGIGLPVLALLKGAFTYTSRYFMAWNAQGVLADLRAELFRSLVERPIASLGRTPVGEFVSRVTNDVQRLDYGLSVRIADILISFPAAIIIAAMLWFWNWRLAAAATVVLPVSAWLVRSWARKLKRASREAQEHTGSLGAVLNETLGGIRVVKAYQSEAHEQQRFASFNERLRRVNLRSYRTRSASSPILELLGAIAIGSLFALAMHEVVGERARPETAVSFFLGLQQLYHNIRRFTAANNEMQNVSAAAKRCFDLLDEADATEPAGEAQVGPLEDCIAFERVDFAHGETEVLRDFDLRIEKGQVVALVGQSGAGKSTVTDLLARFHDVDSGRITWDGTDLRQVDPASLRRQVALVTQDTVVFDDTVTRNIAYGDAAPDRRRVEEAAVAAHADEFIRELEQGYETPLGPGGGRLSGGQRQRIAIARALYKDAPVLVLDEATSALDSQSEAHVQAALAEVMRGRTVLVVAHRLATVKSADKIVVLAGGRILEAGTHSQLVARDGAYRHLHRLQAGA